MIIVTGFGPYGNYVENVSSLIIQALEITDFETEVRKEIIPVSWKFSIKMYKRVLNSSTSKPRLVILTGIHSSKRYYLEKIGLNFAFGNDIDNYFKFGVIEYKLNLWLKTTLDISRIYAILKNNIDVRLSYFAGLYICNYIYFLALSFSRNRYPVLFIHIPHKESVHRGKEIISKIIRTIDSIL
ncbi:MAG: hypothetical protein ACFE8B_01285 [Candidatus Hermodarchaeota archaeon]